MCVTGENTVQVSEVHDGAGMVTALFQQRRNTSLMLNFGVSQFSVIFTFSLFLTKKSVLR